MSFSHDTKNELARVYSERPCCQLAELSAICRMDGVVRLDTEKTPFLVVTNDNAAVARKVFRLFKNLFQVQAEIVIKRQVRLKKRSRYVVRISLSPEKSDMIRGLGLAGNTGGSKYRKVSVYLRRQCCRRAYMRGAFLAGGSVSNPEGAYHLEISTNNELMACKICRVMERCGLMAKTSSRKNWHIVYLKGSDQIAEFLKIIGAHWALLNFENTRVVKGMRNQVNRLVNCETANLDKVVNTALRQTENIRIIEKKMGLDKLSPALREMAELRLKYPGTSLKELGSMMTPRVGKSGANHRMRKLEEIAAKIEKNELPV